MLGRRLLAASAILLAAAAPAEARRGAVVDGTVRVEVITPSLLRIEHAADGRFEDGRTLTTAGRLPSRPEFRTAVRDGRRIVRTSRVVLSWRRDAAPFGAGDLRVRLDGRTLRPRPGPNPAPLGGWRRSLDLLDGPAPLHEGVLSRAGWYLLDDSRTVVLTPDGFRARAGGTAGYQDLYLFAYGHDYARALRDLRTLTGPAPLLPRKAFGVWFSRWWPYGEADWRALVQRFRKERVPLDTISLDTDFKRVNEPVGAAIAAALTGAPGRPYSWNGWDWNRELFPDPAGFLRWAHDEGLGVALNVHPSIDERDPRFPGAQARAGGRLAPDPDCRIPQADTQGQCMVFDWTDPGQLDAYFELHEPFERDGADFWWLDWCCDGSRAEAPGLTPDTWINKQHFDRQRARGSRWPAFQRIGGSYQLGFGGNGGTGAFAEHRYTMQFTGDTCATWPMLAFAAEYTAAAASIGLPYVSHDIGSFFGRSRAGVCGRLSPFLSPALDDLPADMYVRWVQLGTFQPIDRLHSHHGRRLPWEYPEDAGRVAADFLRLREALVPYLYTLARQAHDSGLPMVRPLYLRWPRRPEAYEHPTQYLLGPDLLVAPVTGPGDPARVTVWFPPGTWIDWFTGERHRGPAARSLRVPLERMPVFTRAGSVVPTQPPVLTTPAAPPQRMVLNAQRGSGTAVLYDDAGTGLEHERGELTRTTIRQRRRGAVTRLVIGRARGDRAAAPRTRTYVLRMVGARRPQAVRVAGRATRRWTYDTATRTLTVSTGALATRRAAIVVIRDRPARRPSVRRAPRPAPPR